MKPEGIRKVIAEQSLEGAIIHLAERLDELEKQLNVKEEPPYTPPVEDVKVEGE